MLPPLPDESVENLFPELDDLDSIKSESDQGHLLPSVSKTEANGFSNPTMPSWLSDSEDQDAPDPFSALLAGTPTFAGHLARSNSDVLENSSSATTGNEEAAEIPDLNAFDIDFSIPKADLEESQNTISTPYEENESTLPLSAKAGLEDSTNSRPGTVKIAKTEKIQKAEIQTEQTNHANINSEETTKLTQTPLPVNNVLQPMEHVEATGTTPTAVEQPLNQTQEQAKKQNKIFFGTCGVNKEGLIQILASVKNESQNVWNNCQLSLEKPKKVRKVKCSHTPKIISKKLVWSLTELQKDQSFQVCILIEKTEDTKYLINKRVQFEFEYEYNEQNTSEKQNHAEQAFADNIFASNSTNELEMQSDVVDSIQRSLTLRNLSWKVRNENKSLGYGPFEIQIAVENIGMFASTDVSFQAKDLANQSVYQSQVVDIQSAQQLEFSIPITQTQIGVNDFQIELLKNGKVTESKTVKFTISAPQVEVMITAEKSCELDESTRISVQVINSTDSPLTGFELQITTSEEFQLQNSELNANPSQSQSQDSQAKSQKFQLKELGEHRFDFEILGVMPGAGKVTAKVKTAWGEVLQSTELITCQLSRKSDNALDDLLAIFKSNERKAKIKNEPTISASKVVDTSNKERHILFQLGEMAYTVKLSEVKEVMREPKLSVVPGMPNWVSGVTNVRGEIATIVDLPKFLDLDSSTNGRRALLLCSTSEGLIGFLVNEVNGIKRFQPHDVQQEISDNTEKLTPFMTGIAELNDRLLPVLDLKKLAETLETMAA